MKDFLGNTLAVGDICCTQYSHYKEFRKCKILYFTPCKVKVQFLHDNDEYLCSSHFLIKVTCENDKPTKAVNPDM